MKKDLYNEMKAAKPDNVRKALAELEKTGRLKCLKCEKILTALVL
jgi:hypothetical protein